MKWEKKQVKKDNSVATQILHNIDNYVSDLAATSTQMDVVISSLIEQKDSLTPEQQSELKKQLNTLVKDEADFYKKLNMDGDRVREVNKIINGD